MCSSQPAGRTPTPASSTTQSLTMVPSPTASGASKMLRPNNRVPGLLEKHRNQRNERRVEHGTVHVCVSSFPNRFSYAHSPTEPKKQKKPVIDDGAAADGDATDAEQAVDGRSFDADAAGTGRHRRHGQVVEQARTGSHIVDVPELAPPPQKKNTRISTN